MTKFAFKGLMCPVFTPFVENKKRTVDYDVVEKYALYLKQKGVHGVMVNGYTGEGMTLSLEERKRLAEEWFRVTRKHQLTLLLNIGGSAVTDVYELAEHADKLGVDGIMVLPDLFYRPFNEEDAFYYFRDVAKYAPSTPILYYHFPSMTNVYLKVWRFAELAEKEISTFGGIYYADYNVDHAIETRHTDRTVIFGIEKVFLGAFTLGFHAVSSMMLNLYPDSIFELYDHVHNYRLKEAYVVQDKLFKHIQAIYVHGDDLFDKIKTEFNKLKVGFSVGATRKPTYTGSMIRHYNY